MKVVKMAIASMIAIIAVVGIMIPILGDTVPHDTTYSNVPEGGALYAYYEDSIPSMTIKWDGTRMTVNGATVKWDIHTPAVVTSALTVASQSGTTGPNITHIGIATDETGSTAYGSQISGLKTIDLAVSGGKISGTVTTANHTYTIAETALSWAYMQTYGGNYTAIDSTAGSWYTYGIDRITYQYRNTSTSTYTVHDGKVTKPNGDLVATLSDSDFTSIETIYDEEETTVYKVGMPVKVYTNATTAWAIVNTSVTIDDHEETAVEKIIGIVPLMLLAGLILSLVGAALTRRMD